MTPLKFATTVLEHGILKIPELESFIDQNVEVSIVLKPSPKDTKTDTSIDTFIAKWSGFFTTSKTDDIKYNYLMEKHK